MTLLDNFQYRIGRDKRGIFMELYLVVLVVALCGFTLVAYAADNKEISVSLVTPEEVLKVYGDLDVFEMREIELIKSSLEGLDFEGGDLDEEFLGVFIGEVGKSEEMKEFLFSDMILDGKLLTGGFNQEEFLRDYLYEAEIKSGELVLKRKKIGKAFLLEPKGGVKVSFPVDFKFEFEREYLISKDSDEVMVEKR